MTRTVAVIGAGPAGLTAAYQLAKAGVDVEVFEASGSVGGMARSRPLWGQIVDLGPHRFFSSDPRVNRLWLEVLVGDYNMIGRLTRIYYDHTFFHYPLKPLNALAGLGPVEAAACVASYLSARIRPPADTSGFDGWVTSRFGRRLFEIFFKSYSEKLWGIGCDQLDADFAAQRIKKFSLSEAIRSAFGGGKDGRHKTLVDEFAYPRLGAGMLYERMAERLAALGGKLHLKTPVEAVLPRGEGHERPRLRLADGTERGFDHVISTMPLTLLVQRMGAPADVVAHASALRFRNTILVYLRVAAAALFPDQWIYIHAKELKTGRVTNFSNWSAGIRQGEADTILCLEYWCYDEDPIWQEGDAALIALATRELAATGLAAAGQVTAGHVLRVPRCYPVYERGYKAHLKPVEAYLSGVPGITAIGRYGAFKYNNQDHSILMGLLAAENVTGSGQHELWSLNTDYEYQEASRITATGLQLGP